MLSARRDGVVGRAGRCCRAGGTVLSAKCDIGGERLGVDADRPVGRHGMTTASLLSDAAIASSGVAFSSLGHCCSV